MKTKVSALKEDEDCHQRTCKYWRRGLCYRGESCEFAHKNDKNTEAVEKRECDKCGTECFQHFYCEFFGKTCCMKCTDEEAHDRNYTQNMKVISCKDIHKSIESESINETMSQSKTFQNEETCLCRKSNSASNIKCKECKQYFCEVCPTGPIDDTCLKCISKELGLVSSTPDKTRNN